MKFEANIPSYLRTGQGVFPVKERGMPKPEKETNFYELAKKGFNMPVANDTEGTSFAPISDKKTNEPLDVENFLDKMQRNMNNLPPRMEVNPKSDINLDTKPVMPQIVPGVMRENLQKEWWKKKTKMYLSAREIPFKELMEIINAKHGFFYNENSKKKLNRDARKVSRRIVRRSTRKSTRGS